MYFWHLLLCNASYIVGNRLMSTFQCKFNCVNPFICSWDISRWSFYSYWWPDILVICCCFCTSPYIWIALIWGFIVQLSLWKSVHWLWRYKLNEVCDNMFLPMSPPTEVQSLCQTSSDSWALLSTCSFTSLQATTLKVIDKLNVWIRLLSNTSVYIVTTSKTTSLNFYLSWSLSTIMLWVLLPVFFHSLLMRNIIWTLLFILNMILLSPEPMTSP